MLEMLVTESVKLKKANVSRNRNAINLQGARILILLHISTSIEYDLCPCLVLPESFKSALSTMLDVSLLKDPVFMLIGISNMFGMAGLYVPFVYLVDAAKLNVSELGQHHR